MSRTLKRIAPQPCPLKQAAAHLAMMQIINS
jgi:hypothetical protein